MANSDNSSGLLLENKVTDIIRQLIDEIPGIHMVDIKGLDLNLLRVMDALLSDRRSPRRLGDSTSVNRQRVRHS